MKITFIKTGKRIKSKNEPEKNISNKKDTKKDTPKKKTNENIFREIIKKNQIVVVTVALMLITAGYMNYNNKSENNIELAEIGDAKLVSANIAEDNIEENIANDNEEEKIKDNIEENIINDNLENRTENNTQIDTENNTDTNDKNIETSSNIQENKINNQINEDDYFAKTRLERETMYSQMLEAYQKILENEKIPDNQKGVASNEIKNINDRINAISISENLIKTKGFEDVILLINDNNVNVVVKRKENLKEEEVAQITNIVSRELKVEIENIHISIHI